MTKITEAENNMNEFDTKKEVKRASYMIKVGGLYLSSLNEDEAFFTTNKKSKDAFRAFHDKDDREVTSSDSELMIRRLLVTVKALDNLGVCGAEIVVVEDSEILIETETTVDVVAEGSSLKMKKRELKTEDFNI